MNKENLLSANKRPSSQTLRNDNICHGDIIEKNPSTIKEYGEEW